MLLGPLHDPHDMVRIGRPQLGTEMVALAVQLDRQLCGACTSRSHRLFPNDFNPVLSVASTLSWNIETFLPSHLSFGFFGFLA